MNDLGPTPEQREPSAENVFEQRIDADAAARKSYFAYHASKLWEDDDEDPADEEDDRPWLVNLAVDLREAARCAWRWLKDERGADVVTRTGAELAAERGYDRGYGAACTEMLEVDRDIRELRLERDRLQRNNDMLERRARDAQQLVGSMQAVRREVMREVSYTRREGATSIKRRDRLIARQTPAQLIMGSDYPNNTMPRLLDALEATLVEGTILGMSGEDEAAELHLEEAARIRTRIIRLMGGGPFDPLETPFTRRDMIDLLTAQLGYPGNPQFIIDAMKAKWSK